MSRARPRPLTAFDLGLLALVAAACFWAARATDREYAGIPQGRAENTWSRWPEWIRGGIPVAVRVGLGVKACLATACLGLAGITYRSRRLRPDRPGPGQVAVLISTGFTLFWAAFDALADRIYPLIPLPPGTTWGNGPVVVREWYAFWTLLSPLVVWSLIAAWISLAITGGWRQSADWSERIGLWLGWGWIASQVGSEIITLIVRS